jgi:glutathione peroxidase-family protein
MECCYSSYGFAFVLLSMVSVYDYDIDHLYHILCGEDDSLHSADDITVCLLKDVKNRLLCMKPYNIERSQ